MRRTIFIALLFISLLTDGALAANSDDLYTQGRYEDAINSLQNDLRREPRSARLHTNLACALYHLNRYDEAIKALREAAQLETDAARAARIQYNLGNCYFTANHKNEAIEAYKAALRLNPDDALAKYNLEIALKNSPQPPPDKPRSQSGGGNNNNQNPPPPPDNQPKPDAANNKGPQPPPKMTRDDAEHILDAMRQNERGPGRQGNLPRNYFDSATKRDW